MDISGENNDSIDWDSEDELEIQDIHDTAYSDSRSNRQHAFGCDGEASSSSVPCWSEFSKQFLGMGFPLESIAKAIEQNGENFEVVLNTLLTFKAIEESPEGEPSANCTQLDPNFSYDSSSEYEENFADGVYEEDSWSSDSDGDFVHSVTLEDNNNLSEKEQTLLSLTKMGYSVEEASIAMERCPDATLGSLIDFICAAQLSRAEDPYLPEDIKPKISNGSGYKKRKMHKELCQRGKRKAIIGEEEPIRIPKPMIGFGIPGVSYPGNSRKTLPEQAVGPPYFYYENVALAPKGVWDTISRMLYDIEPEFVDSKYFCAAARKRGYIHNLPVENRFPLLPPPPLTISEALPLTRKWWPSWDSRTKLNCLQTAIGSAKLTERLRNALERYNGDPPEHVQTKVLDECRKWNLVWVGRNKVAPLEPDEVEMLLGFPKNHTRGISRTDRYKSLGNSFQVDTVAYHLSVLRALYPMGVNVLSLFSGIGGAEVAFYRLGIPLKTVVSVEKSEVNRNIVRSWWDQTNQKGTLIDFEDVQQVNGDILEKLIDAYGGFDLVIGGSPCNNLAGSNRVSRDGLEGSESSLFYDYVRILELVKSIMSEKV